VRLIRLGPEALKEGEERLKQLEQQKTKRNAGKA